MKVGADAAPPSDGLTEATAVLAAMFVLKPGQIPSLTRGLVLKLVVQTLSPKQSQLHSIYAQLNTWNMIMYVQSQAPASCGNVLLQEFRA